MDKKINNLNKIINQLENKNKKLIKENNDLRNKNKILKEILDAEKINDGLMLLEKIENLYNKKNIEKNDNYYKLIKSFSINDFLINEFNKCFYNYNNNEKIFLNLNSCYDFEYDLHYNLKSLIKLFIFYAEYDYKIEIYDQCLFLYNILSKKENKKFENEFAEYILSKNINFEKILNEIIDLTKNINFDYCEKYIKDELNGKYYNIFNILTNLSKLFENNDIINNLFYEEYIEKILNIFNENFYIFNFDDIFKKYYIIGYVNSNESIKEDIKIYINNYLITHFKFSNDKINEYSKNIYNNIDDKLLNDIKFILNKLDFENIKINISYDELKELNIISHNNDIVHLINNFINFYLNNK